jgi:hypothetical protein
MAREERAAKMVRFIFKDEKRKDLLQPMAARLTRTPFIRCAQASAAPDKPVLFSSAHFLAK